MFSASKKSGEGLAKTGEHAKNRGSDIQIRGSIRQNRGNGSEIRGSRFKSRGRLPAIGAAGFKFGAVVLKIGGTADGFREYKTFCGKRNNIISEIAQRLRVPFWIHRLWQNDKQFLKSRATGI
jgi:hypothetical protein